MEKLLLEFNKYNKKIKTIKNDIKYIDSIKKYVNLIKQRKLEKIHYDYDIKNPKISFITPVFNKEKYLESLILSIQHQYMEHFEIIFIDDSSNDNTIKNIKEFSKIDRRIKLIKNGINRGTLYSRCQGALKSKGE